MTFDGFVEDRLGSIVNGADIGIFASRVPSPLWTTALAYRSLCHQRFAGLHGLCG
jgi:hypothetical protein